MYTEMNIYIRKPTGPIKAVQWFPGVRLPGVIDNDQTCYVVTVQGQHVKVSPGEWIIEELDRVHHYPCSDEVFKETYENTMICSFDRTAFLKSEVTRLQNWVNDCQKGMYVNCVYCGHRYGPDTEVPATMADVLYEHIKICEEHPLSEALAKSKENEDIIAALVADNNEKDRYLVSVHNQLNETIKRKISEKVDVENKLSVALAEVTRLKSIVYALEMEK